MGGVVKDAKSYWDHYYEKAPFKSGKAPNNFLVQMLPRLQKGRALDIAMGEGENAVYLAQKGFDVIGFDISPVAVQHARQLAKDTGVEVEAKTADLDMYLMGVMQYDAVIMTRFRPAFPRYYAAIISALKQGGTFLIDTFGIPEMDESIGKDEQYRNIFFGSNEVLRHIKDLRILFYQEGKVDGRHVVQLLAQKPIDRHAAKYDVFDMHTKGSQKEKDSTRHQLDLAEKFFKK